jgi:hypothetical protein
MKPAQHTTPADFGVWEVAYKVSETGPDPAGHRLLVAYHVQPETFLRSK